MTFPSAFYRLGFHQESPQFGGFDIPVILRELMWFLDLERKSLGEIFGSEIFSCKSCSILEDIYFRGCLCSRRLVEVSLLGGDQRVLPSVRVAAEKQPRSVFSLFIASSVIILSDLLVFYFRKINIFLLTLFF